MIVVVYDPSTVPVLVVAWVLVWVFIVGWAVWA